jgi:hypothetical protein
MENLGKYAKLAREHSQVLVLPPTLLPQLFPVGHKVVKQVVDDVRLEDADPERIRHLLSLPFNFDVKGQDDSIPAGRQMM